MCKSITLLRPGHGPQVIKTAGEAQKAFGKANIVWLAERLAMPSRYPSWNECLCWLDFTATAARTGHAVRPSESDSFEMIFESLPK